MKKSKLALAVLLSLTSSIANSADPAPSPLIKILDVLTGGAGTDNQAQAAPTIKLAEPASDSNTATKTQLVIPKDEKIKSAIDAALPNIKKILSIHSCLIDPQGLRLLNQYAMPGVNLESHGFGSGGPVPPIMTMQYHNKNKCVGVRSIDQFSMPALNALQYRVVYFANDSGETRSYQFLLQKSEDGNWLLTDRSYLIN